MEENKNLTPEEVVEEVTEETTVEEIATTKKTKKEKKQRPKREKLLKNQALLKKGSYSLALTAAFLIGAIVLNILVSALSDRFVLEFDMSFKKDFSMNEENIDYIKTVKDKVEITVCADKENYASYMPSYAQQYEVSDNEATSYYEQTLKLVDKYAAYNKNITVNYVDTQSSEFSPIAAKYKSDGIGYGDILVVSNKNGVERHKVVRYKDIYNLTQNQEYAAYGYNIYTVSGNNIENALTSAVSYVVSLETKKIGFITGHSAKDYTADYQKMLKENNYEIVLISDQIITSIPEDLDAVVLAAPTSDFMAEELNLLSAFLDNDGKLGKGFIFFADVNSPYLTNLYEFLEQWGISVGEGVLFDTGNYHLTDDPCMLYMAATGEDNISDNVNICISGYNVPIEPCIENTESKKVTNIIATAPTVVAAPKGVDASWTGAGDYTPAAYSGLLQTKVSNYYENEPVASYVTVFGSVEFIYSQYNEYSDVSNKEITLSCAERSAGADNIGIHFTSKTITNESFADSVNQAEANAIRIIFMFLLPVALIVAGVYVFIRRKNA